MHRQSSVVTDNFLVFANPEIGLGPSIGVAVVTTNHYLTDLKFDKHKSSTLVMPFSLASTKRTPTLPAKLDGEKVAKRFKMDT